MADGRAAPGGGMPLAPGKSDYSHGYRRRRAARANRTEVIMKLLIQLTREESGQDLIEYALLASLIAIVSVAALTILGPTVSQLFTRVNEAFTS